MSYKPVYPDFNKDSLVNLMSSILAHYDLSSPYPILDKHYLKNIEGCEKLVFFLIDGFGQNIWKKYALNYSLFKTLSDNTDKSSITSVFPSTTAAALTTIHTGLPPKTHGILEWNVYFKELNAVISTIPYQIVSPIYDSQALSKYKNNSGILINNITIYEKLLKKNVKSYILYPKQFIRGTYNREAFKGGLSSLYISLSDLLIELTSKLESTKGKAYFFVYWPFLDTTEHFYGPFTRQTEMHIKMLNDMIQDLLIKNINKASAKKIGLILTADHGQLACNPEETAYLNEIKNINSFFRKTSTKQYILPSGNPRDIFLHIKKESIAKSKAEINAFLKNKADVFLLDKSTLDRFFGDDIPHPSFFDRVGDMLILPKDNNLAWYQYLPNEPFVYKGTHGGFTEEEMMIPLLAKRLIDLR
ncbi:MAG: hypothetical protein COU25_00980 [Candidatus Levybacteria bacterium CG10_big_fil_rev_8_21_14_0_10_35_13]|nr:MAG: hypothetical protein COU25_00980 [Candidatus Levybacteria bacterium CG10_big_fil_rev_8_21_14_0_10_35_13]